MATPRIEVPRAEMAEVCRRHRIRRLALFGSVLRDDFGPHSDVDVLVTFAPDARIGFLALGRLKRELSELLGRRVDIVPEDGLKPLIRERVLSSAEVIYAA